MLHFNKMILRDFGPYKGEQTIDFSDRSGVSIFWGNNGRGKTTLLNAFRYGLFGVVQRRNGVLKNISEMSNQEARDEGRYGFSVTLEMTNDNDRYRLTRQLSLRDGVTKPAGEEDYEKIISLNKNGSILSPEDREHELNVIMPAQVARFFLFDAELLQEYEELLEVNTTTGDQIKNSIEKILGLPVLQNGIIDIGDCLSQYEKKKTRAASEDSKTQQYANELESLSANIEEHANIISEKKAYHGELIAKKAKLESDMQDKERLSNWIAEKREKEANKKKAEDDLEKTKTELRELTREAWKGMLVNTIRDFRESMEQKATELDTKRQTKKVAERFILEIRKAISDRVCPVCGQDVSVDLVQHLKKQIEEQSGEFSGLTEEERQELSNLQSRLGTIKKLSADIEDVKPRITALEDRKERLELDLGQLKQDIDELKDNISRYGEDVNESFIMNLAKDYSSVEQEISDTIKGIEAETDKMNELKVKKDALSSTIDKQASGISYRTASRKFELCDHVYKIFEESKAIYRERLKENVQKDATDLFVKLTGDKDYVGLQINDNYGLEIIHKSGRKVPGRSSGYEHVVALSLIGALHMNAPLRGPIIMDSPFGRLDLAHKANIAKTLSLMAEQCMLLVYVGEIDDQVARKEIGNNLIHEFKLERVSSMYTRIN